MVDLRAGSDRSASVRFEEPALNRDHEPYTREGRWSTGLTVAAFVVPLAAYFVFIHHYSVNAVWYDQWWDVQLLGHWYSGSLNLHQLWAQHGENRIFFPNLIVILLAETTHFNIVFEEYVSGILLAVSVGLIILAHKRRSPSTRWVFYLPVAVLMLSFVQYQDTLWGFQLAWYLALFALAVAVYLLDRPKLSRPITVIAIAVAVIGSFSSLQGLLIWPAGLLLLYQRGRSKTSFLWLAFGVITGAVYFYDLNLRHGDSTYAFVHPAMAVEYFLLAIGDVLGVQVSPHLEATTDALMALGFVIVILACWCLFNYGRRRDEVTGSPVGACLILYGLLFAGLMTVGRADGGLSVAATSRYTTYDLLIPVGCYLTMLGRVHRLETDRGREHLRQRRWARQSSAIALGILVFVMCLQVAVGTTTGLAQARNWYLLQRASGRVTVNTPASGSAYESNLLLPTCDCPYFAATLPQLTQILRTHHLSMFATNDAAVYAREGLPHEGTPPATRLLHPSSGETLSGNVFLTAAASDVYGVTKVEFRLSGGSMHDELISVGGRFVYGWIAGWSTTSVPNGTYEIQSFAYGAGGDVGRSQDVVVRVANG